MTSKKIKKKGARTPSALVAINRLAAGAVPCSGQCTLTTVQS